MFIICNFIYTKIFSKSNELKKYIELMRVLGTTYCKKERNSREISGKEFIPNHSEICFRANVNQSEKNFQSSLLKIA